MLDELWKAIGGPGARLLPESASSFAHHDDKIMIYLLTVSVIFSLGIFTALLAFAFKYRHRPGNLVSREVKVSYWLEALWTLVPFAIVLVAFFWGAHRYLDQMTPRLEAEHIFVIGKQWMWKVEHDNGVAELGSLHVPVGRDVSLLMISQDVIHSFFIPDFRAKYDVLPGRYTRLWFKAEKPGRYLLLCTQYCGMDHARMGGWVVAMPEPEYRAWLKAQESTLRSQAQARGRPQDRGAKLFVTHGCVSCHGTERPVASGEGTQLTPIAPRLFDRFKRGDEDFLRDSITRPNSLVRAGYPAVMPTYSGLLKEEEIHDLIAYLTTETAHD